MSILNLGILAHVDAGKTTLTERLLLTAGAIDTLGSVDAGTTHTDSLALERRRGITIRAAVAAFSLGDVSVNLIDTPGHPDFIAEVERSLGVLDGVVLVISAVEGVQAQTVVLMRALRRFRLPTVLFVNKIDRPGADPGRVIEEIRDRVTPEIVVMGAVIRAGQQSAAFQPFADDDPVFVESRYEALIHHDETLLTEWLDESPVAGASLPGRLTDQSAAGLLHPVYFGSAATGAGIASLITAFGSLLPAAGEDPGGPVSAAVFKIDRGHRGEKTAYVRMFTGSVRVRDHVDLDTGRTGTVTAIGVFEHGGLTMRDVLSAGHIGILTGLRDARVGDVLGTGRPPHETAFAPPTLRTAVIASDPSRKSDLHTALARLAEQDPLINITQDDDRQELFVSLYGEVQKEVIEHALRVDSGVAVQFRETTVICVERLTSRGEALVRLGDPDNPCIATIGLTLEAGPVGTGIEFRIGADVATLPLYVYKSVDAFRAAITEYVRGTLGRGPRGWQINDCLVTLTASDYVSPLTTARDFRDLTPLVVAAALAGAGTVACEPIQRFRLDAPADTVAAVFNLLGRYRAQPRGPMVNGSWFTVEGDIPAAEVQLLQRQLPGSTHGSGVLEVHFDRYEPIPHSASSRADQQRPSA